MVRPQLILDGGYTNECTICGKTFHKQSMRAVDKIFKLHMKTVHKETKIDTREDWDILEDGTKKVIQGDNRRTRRYKMFK